MKLVISKREKKPNARCCKHILPNKHNSDWLFKAEICYLHRHLWLVVSWVVYPHCELDGDNLETTCRALSLPSSFLVGFVENILESRAEMRKGNMWEVANDFFKCIINWNGDHDNNLLGCFSSLIIRLGRHPRKAINHFTYYSFVQQGGSSLPACFVSQYFKVCCKQKQKQKQKSGFEFMQKRISSHAGQEKSQCNYDKNAFTAKVECRPFPAMLSELWVFFILFFRRNKKCRSV